jgi:nucleoside-diphosphate-sugar epimerase
MKGMPGSGRRVRAQRSAAATSVVAVTGATGELGRRLLRRLADSPEVAGLVAVDTVHGDIEGVSWRRADVRDPVLRSRFAGADVVVHLATERDADAPEVDRRALNVLGTDNVLGSAASAGVKRVVLVTSAMVYGADAANPVPLPEDAPVRAEADATLVGDWVEIERLAAAAPSALAVTVMRPASLVGPVRDALLPRLFEAPRLLALRGVEAHWQFCHSDDLVSALEWAALGRVEGEVTVGCDGWLGQAAVEAISGMRSIVVPASMAFGTAERLHRVGALPAPARELHYLANPWVVGSQRLHAAGWSPAWDNAAALRAHLDALGEAAGAGSGLARFARSDATRAAAGATVALAGALAIASARAARRRRRG